MEPVPRIAAVLAAILAATFGATAAAQDIAASDSPETVSATESDAVPLSLIETWQADPTRIFESGDITLAELQYVARPLIVFADNPADPNFIEQLALIENRIGDLAVRDVIVITDTDPAARSPLRQTLRPRGFGLVLIGKDGRIAQRKPSPWDVREISRAIDKLPLRQQEIREGR